jgi:hypothetical protein
VKKSNERLTSAVKESDEYSISAMEETHFRNGRPANQEDLIVECTEAIKSLAK